jgi:hypothetical protein
LKIRKFMLCCQVLNFYNVIREIIEISVAGTGSGAFLTPGSYFRELRNRFWVKILKFFDADPGWKKVRIRDKYHGSATLIEMIIESSSGLRRHCK